MPGVAGGGMKRRNTSFHGRRLLGVTLTMGTCRLRFVQVSGTGKEKAMAAHSSALAWRIPWMEEPGGLQSMGSLGVGHD